MRLMKSPNSRSGRQLAFRDPLVEPGLEDRLEQADLALAGVFAERLQRLRADAAPRGGGGADERRVVVLVGQQPQVGAQVLDLGLVEERLPAGDLVGDLLLAQHLLDDARLVVAAVEDGEVGKGAALLELGGLQAHHHRLGLVLVVVAGDHLDRVAEAERGPQPLGVQLGVVVDQRVGGSQDGAAGAVVLLELDHLQLRIVVGQAPQVLQGRAAPAVDRLVVVAHRGEAVAFADQFPQQLVLGGVGVLVFVDQEVAQPLAPQLRALAASLRSSLSGSPIRSSKSTAW